MLQINKLPTLCTNRVHTFSRRGNTPKQRVFRVPFCLISFLAVNIFFASCEARKTQTPLTSQTKEIAIQKGVDINSADAAELERLPRIGPKMAAKIVLHRERFGPFRRTAELMMVEGFSEARYMAIRQLVRAD